MYDAIIVGSGTVGLTIANLLANLGLKICLLEKNSGLNSVSNAVGVNDECLFAWRECGILEEIKEYIGYNENGKTILKYLDEAKKEIFSLQQSSGIGNFPKGVVFLQNKIDEVLLKNLAGKAEVIFNEELVDISQNQEIVTAKSKNNTYQAKYLIAADGKESTVRKLLNIEINELSKSKDQWLILNILTKNRSLEKDFVEVYCGKRSVVSCPLPYDYHRIEASLLPQEAEILHDENQIRELIKNYIDFSDYEIASKFKIRFVTAIASKYQEGRIALCGDAAHQTSPFASAGLVSGIRDCLVLYDLFKSGKVDFCKYQKLRYKKQLRSLHLAMTLENVMRPNSIFSGLVFFALKILSKSAAFVRYLSIRS